MEIRYQPIGVIHSPFKKPEGMPIQPTSEKSAPGVAEVYPEFAEGLADLAGFSHVILLYHLHQVRTVKLKVIPFLDTTERGVFATRAPSRPNPIGLSTVELLRVEGNRLHLGNVDILDGTPLLDIKPYVPDFDGPVEIRTGWYEAARSRFRATRSDGRFE